MIILLIIIIFAVYQINQSAKGHDTLMNQFVELVRWIQGL